jgi:HPt (histidine-containing phosphotransfer) domain-containing protein
MAISPNEPHIKLDTIKELRELKEADEPSLLDQLIDMFFESSQSKIDAICQAVETEDWEKAERDSHTLKSTAGNLGLHRLYLLCQEVEDFCRNKNPESKSLLTDLRAEYQTIQPLLKEHHS